MLTILAFAAGVALLVIALGVTDGRAGGVDLAHAADPQPTLAAALQPEPRPRRLDPSPRSRCPAMDADPLGP